jgi:hypothetical protein
MNESGPSLTTGQYLQSLRKEKEQELLVYGRELKHFASMVQAIAI